MLRCSEIWCFVIGQVCTDDLGESPASVLRVQKNCKLCINHCQNH